MMVDAITGAIDDLSPDARHRHFRTLDDSVNWPADVAIVDVSAVSPIANGPRRAGDRLGVYCDAHPHTEVIVCSAVGAGFANEMIDGIRESHPDSVISCVGVVQLYDSLVEKLTA
jgi:hypothetical protein